jgi:hypothetical protein
MSKKTPPRTVPSHQEFIKQIRALCHRHPLHRVFRDFMELAALAIANSVDLSSMREKREARYLEVIKAYSPEEAKSFAQLLGLLIELLEAEARPADVLGVLFHELELQNKWKGQFFTPQSVSDMMTLMLSSDGHAETIERQGFVRVHEPTCGSGTMLLSMAHAMREEGLNPQTQMHATAIDIDELCVHMTFIQLSLWHIPGIVLHGNSLAVEVWDTWFTPAHILGGWTHRLRRDPTPGPLWAEVPKADRLAVLRRESLSPRLAMADQRPPELAHVDLTT